MSVADTSDEEKSGFGAVTRYVRYHVCSPRQRCATVCGKWTQEGTWWENIWIAKTKYNPSRPFGTESTYCTYRAFIQEQAWKQVMGELREIPGASIDKFAAVHRERGMLNYQMKILPPTLERLVAIFCSCCLKPQTGDTGSPAP